MGRNTKPLLTVLIDEDKRERLRAFAESKNLSMGKLINQLIDRAMAGDIDIHSNTSSITESSKSTELTSTGIDRKNIEELVERVIEKTSLGIERISIEELIRVAIENSSVGLNRADIEALIDESIASHASSSDDSSNKELIDTLTDRIDSIEKRLNVIGERTCEDAPQLDRDSLLIESTAAMAERLEAALVPIREEIGEVSEFARSIQGTVVQLSRINPKPTTTSHSNPTQTPAAELKPNLPALLAEKLTWSDFHAAVGLVAPPTANRNVAAAQVAMNRASELGYPNWRYSSKGHLFVRQS